MHSIKIGFLGGGNMTRSLVSGLVKSGFCSQDVFVYDRNGYKLDELKSVYNINICKNIAEIINQCDAIVLSVKPQSLPDLVLEIGDSIRLKRLLLISICAGVSTNQLSSWFGFDLPIARVMPNTPSLLQCGAAGMFSNSYLAQQQKSIVEKIFRASGVAIWVEKEELMDVICSISGSGPAYFFLFMEILADLGHEFGLKPDDSKLLATQTAYGASRMALELDGNDLETLRTKVTSKGGTTEAAISTLETGGIRGIMKSAIINNIKRGKELSELSQGSPKLLS